MRYFFFNRFYLCRHSEITVIRYLQSFYFNRSYDRTESSFAAKTDPQAATRNLNLNFSFVGSSVSVLLVILK